MCKLPVCRLEEYCWFRVCFVGGWEESKRPLSPLMGVASRDMCGLCHDCLPCVLHMKGCDCGVCVCESKLCVCHVCRDC